ncbi:MAG TPA: glycosyltransferase [Nocardioides sp.]
MTGLTAYQDVCFRELAALGDDVLLVHPPTMPFADFDKTKFSREVTRIVWSPEMPSAAELVPQIEAFDPDVVIMWSWDGAGYRAVMKHFRGRALRVMFSSNFWHGTAKQYAGLVARHAYVTPLFDAVWVPGERSEEFARRIGFRGRQVIRGANSADVSLFARGPRSGSELAARSRFLFTGRLIWHKAPTLLAEAYTEYRSAVSSPWDLDIVGGGPLAADFAGIPGVGLEGFMQPVALADRMQEVSCLILPSHIEWYGVVVHEAAVAGLPVICSDGVGAVPHLLQDGFNGWTVEAGSRSELVTAMVRMSSASPARLESMSRGSQALGSRLTPEIWAVNLHEELERRLV